MKKFYFALGVLPMLCALSAAAQPCVTSITSPDNDTVCTGSTVTLQGSTIGAISTLSTTMSAGNNHRGNMFDITATNPVIITSFDAHPMGNTTSKFITARRRMQALKLLLQDGSSSVPQQSLHSRSVHQHPFR
jgi:hypothetical protein